MRTIYSIPLIFIEQQSPGYWLKLNDDIYTHGARVTDSRALDIFHHIMILEMTREEDFVFRLKHPELIEFVQT
jgi:hypothetical protein